VMAGQGQSPTVGMREVTAGVAGSLHLGDRGLGVRKGSPTVGKLGFPAVAENSGGPR